MWCLAITIIYKIRVMKVIIAGGRGFKDYDLLCEKVDKILSQQDEIVIVSGTAKGADKLGERYAAEHGYPVKTFIPDWGGLGKKAGFIRNEDMALYADALILFWDEVSKGSRHMFHVAEEHGLLTRIIKYNELENEN